MGSIYITGINQLKQMATITYNNKEMNEFYEPVNMLNAKWLLTITKQEFKEIMFMKEENNPHTFRRAERTSIRIK